MSIEYICLTLAGTDLPSALVHIDLVAQHHKGEAFCVMRGCLNKELITPVVEVLKRLGVVYVIHKHAAICTAVVSHAQRLEALLSGGVPDLMHLILVRADAATTVHTCIVTRRLSTVTSFVRLRGSKKREQGYEREKGTYKSAPMVALYWELNRELTNWFMSEVFPTLDRRSRNVNWPKSSGLQHTPTVAQDNNLTR